MAENTTNPPAVTKAAKPRTVLSVLSETWDVVSSPLDTAARRRLEEREKQNAELARNGGRTKAGPLGLNSHEALSGYGSALAKGSAIARATAAGSPGPYNDPKLSASGTADLDYRNRPFIQVIGDSAIDLLRFSDFILTGFSGSDVEKAEVVETFGLPLVVASGRFMRKYTFTGASRIAAANPQGTKAAFKVSQYSLLQLFYEKYMRATEQAKLGRKTRITVDREEFDGYVVTFSPSKTSDSEGFAGFTFTMLVTDRRFVDPDAEQALQAYGQTQKKDRKVLDRQIKAEVADTKGVTALKVALPDSTTYSTTVTFVGSARTPLVKGSPLLIGKLLAEGGGGTVKVTGVPAGMALAPFYVSKDPKDILVTITDPAAAYQAMSKDQIGITLAINDKSVTVGIVAGAMPAPELITLAPRLRVGDNSQAAAGAKLVAADSGFSGDALPVEFIDEAFRGRTFTSDDTIFIDSILGDIGTASSKAYDQSGAFTSLTTNPSTGTMAGTLRVPGINALITNNTSAFASLTVNYRIVVKGCKPYSGTLNLGLPQSQLGTQLFDAGAVFTVTRFASKVPSESISSTITSGFGLFYDPTDTVYSDIELRVPLSAAIANDPVKQAAALKLAKSLSVTLTHEDYVLDVGDKVTYGQFTMTVPVGRATTEVKWTAGAAQAGVIPRIEGGMLILKVSVFPSAGDTEDVSSRLAVQLSSNSTDIKNIPTQAK
jgi:hypothetical protein